MGNELYQKEVSKQFYENRYQEGYMSEWPIEKKRRIFEIIRVLDLPENGNALDFGCGNGIFTDVLRLALPKWKIFGCDISKNAIDNAKKRFPECSFFVSDNELNCGVKFDFLFSHHVLEHAFDIKKTITEINNLLKPLSFVLHIFPCGNENSFEYNVSKMQVNGINAEMGNRFFFEDEGHIRRLTTIQTNGLMNEYGFTLEKDLYSNQYYGAIKWISQSFPNFIMNFSNPKKAINKKAYKSLVTIRFMLISLMLLQLPVTLFNHIKIIKNKKIKHYIYGLIALIHYLISYPIYATINYKAQKEWKYKNHLKNGSEMYLLYIRK